MALDYQNFGGGGSSGGGLDWNSLLSGGGQIGSGLINLLTGNNAAGQLSGAIGGVIPQQQGVQSNISNLYSPYRTLGQGAAGGLGSFLGLPGSTPFNSSTLNNFPGLDFLTQRGDQAIRNQSTANGSLYTPQTMMNMANYNQGVGLTNAIQPYLQTLLSSAGMGMQGSQGTAQGALTTGNNIGQALIGQGAANASGTAASATPINSIFQGGEGLLKNYLGGGGNNPFSNIFGGSGAGGGADTSGFNLFANSGGYTGAGSSLSGFDIGMNDISSGLSGSLNAGLGNYADSGISALGDLFPGASGQAATAGLGVPSDFGALGGGASADAAGGAADAGLGLAGNVALPIAMFAGMDALFNHQSTYNSEDTQTDLAKAANNPNNPLSSAFQTMLKMYQANPTKAGQQLFQGGGMDPRLISWNQY